MKFTIVRKRRTHFHVAGTGVVFCKQPGDLLFTEQRENVTCLNCKAALQQNDYEKGAPWNP